MATPDVTAVTVLEASAALNNDTAQAVYTNAAQLPYFNMALRDLQKYFELNDVPVTEETSAEVEVDAGVTEITFAGPPTLPQDLIVPKTLWQRPQGIDPYIPILPKVEFLPQYLAGQPTNIILCWAWNSNKIKFLPSNADLDVKIDYIKNLFTVCTSANLNTYTLGVINSDSYLIYRTAALCARYIGEDKPRYDDLMIEAGLSIDMAVGIETKGKQMIATRRRPFMASYKRQNTR